MTAERGLEPAGMWGSEPRFPGASEGNPYHPGPQSSAKTECPPMFPASLPTPEALCPPRPPKVSSLPPFHSGFPPLQANGFLLPRKERKGNNWGKSVRRGT